MIGTTEVAAAEREVTRFFRALADETRLAIVRLLMLNDLRAGEVVQHLQLPANGVSYHLKHLRDVGLLRDRRSSLDARDIYYTPSHSIGSVYGHFPVTVPPSVLSRSNMKSRGAEA